LVDPLALSTPSALAGARRVETHVGDVAERRTRAGNGDVQPLYNLLEADVRALDRARGMLTEPVDEEPALVVDQGVIDGRSAEINAGYDVHGSLPPLRR
jgi:hypothetical protein